MTYFDFVDSPLKAWPFLRMLNKVADPEQNSAATVAYASHFTARRFEGKVYHTYSYVNTTGMVNRYRNTPPILC